MEKRNQNSISPFLVNNQFSMLEGAEKALIQINAALFPEKQHSLFSFSLTASEPQHTLRQLNAL